MANGPAKVGVIGCMGRMGVANIEALKGEDSLKLHAASEIADHPMIGAKVTETDIVITDKAENVFTSSDVVIDFTPPGNTAKHAGFAATYGTRYIVGTTGLDGAAHGALDAAAGNTVIVQAGNFSLGVNVMTAFVQKMAKVLDEDWDIEILEMHHRHKIDAPSGTAMMIGEAAALGRGVSLDDTAVKSRDGITGERKQGDIGFATLRGGSVIGEHEAIFASDSERLTIAHRAENRGLFASGAVRAAKWSLSVERGRFDMLDVLGLKNF